VNEGSRRHDVIPGQPRHPGRKSPARGGDKRGAIAAVQTEMRRGHRNPSDRPLGQIAMRSAVWRPQQTFGGISRTVITTLSVSTPDAEAPGREARRPAAPLTAFASRPCPRSVAPGQGGADAAAVCVGTQLGTRRAPPSAKSHCLAARKYEVLRGLVSRVRWRGVDAHAPCTWTAVLWANRLDESAARTGVGPMAVPRVHRRASCHAACHIVRPRRTASTVEINRRQALRTPGSCRLGLPNWTGLQRVLRGHLQGRDPHERAAREHSAR